MYLPIQHTNKMINSNGDDMVTGKHMFLWFAIIFSVLQVFYLFEYVIQFFVSVATQFTIYHLAIYINFHFVETEPLILMFKILLSTW